MYQVGDYVVKSVTGVCRIKDITSLDFLDRKGKLYYQLTPLSDEGANVYVPVEGVHTGIRAVMTPEEARDLIGRIPEIEKANIFNEKERERKYKEAIKSNNPETLIGMLKLIYQRKQKRTQQGKKVTDADKKYFEAAEHLLYSELKVSMSQSETEIKDIIKEKCEEESNLTL